MAVDILLWQPAFDDDIPGSSFLTRTNNFTESFIRVGIQTHTPKRWVFWRITSPDYCQPEISSCGEDGIAKRAQESYDNARHYSKFWYRPWQMIPAGVQMMAMNATDAAWNGLTAPSGQASDGFIHGAGQVYPRALQNRLIVDGHSHVGTAKSPKVWLQLKAALKDPSLFGLEERP